MNPMEERLELSKEMVSIAGGMIGVYGTEEFADQLMFARAGVGA